MRRHIRRRTVFFILLATIWTATLFFFSGQNAQESSQLSGSLAQWVFSRLPPGTISFRELEHILRKLAHFSIFAIEGLLLMLAVSGGRLIRRSFSIALVISVLMAVSNEIHQLTSSGRSCQFTDMLIDASGALAGICIAATIIHLYRTRRNSTRKNSSTIGEEL